MTLVLIVSALAVAVGLLLHGQLSGLPRVPLHRRRLLVTAAVTAWVGDLLSLVWSPTLVVGLVLASGLVAYFAWLNRSVPGLALIGAGCGLNGLVLMVNAGMPVSLHAAKLAGARLSEPLLAASTWREAATGDTILPYLGQVIPLAWPISPKVVSVGDVLIAAGCGLFLVAGMIGESGQRHGTLEPTEETKPAPEPAAPVVS